MALASIRERIQAAKAVAPEHRDVDVVLDQEVAGDVEKLEEQIDGLEEQISDLEDEQVRITPDLRFDDPRPVEIRKQIDDLREQIVALEEQRDALRQGTLLRLRFDKMEGEAWASIAAKHPARVDSTIDRLSGYDYHATALEAAPLCGYALGEDDAREDLTPEDWEDLLPLLSGREIETLATSLWELNDWGPRRRVDAARKASSAASASKSS